MEVQSFVFGSGKVWSCILPLRLLGLLNPLARLLCGVFLGAVSAHADALDRWSPRFQRPPQTRMSHADIIYGNGLFVAIGGDSGSLGLIYTSPDGVVWTARHQTTDADFTVDELRKIALGNGRFVAVGWNCSYASDNGIDWVGGSVGRTATFYDVCYGQGKFVAISRSGGTNAFTSVDGLNWTGQRLADDGLVRITYGNNRFLTFTVANPLGPTRSLTSVDAVSWSYNALTFKPMVSGLTWGNGVFVAVGRAYNFPNAGMVMSSPDGVTWTQHDYGASNALGHVECVNGLFIATGDGILLTSTNGTHWESRQSTNRISRFAMGNGALMGISGNVAVRPDGPDLYQSDPLLQLQILRANPAELSLSGFAGQTCRIEAADQVGSTWTPLTDVVLSTSPTIWTDTNAVPSPQRLYRGNWVR